MWIHSATQPGSKAFDGIPHFDPDVQANKKPEKAAGLIGPQLVARTTTLVEAITAPSPEPVSLFQQVDSGSPAYPQRPWARWAILAAVPLVITGLLMLILMPGSHPKESQEPQVQPAAQQSEAPVASTTTPRTAGARATKPSAASRVAGPAQTTPVSSEMMDAQLNAPSRISGTIKKPAPVEAAPDGFSPSAIDSGNALPEQVFSSSHNVKIVPARSAISAGVAEGMLIHRTAPTYPEFAKSTHMHGTVVLGATITKDGTISNLRALSGPPMLRAPATDAVKTWRYRPYLLNNQPVDVETTISVIFSLDGR